MTVSGGIWWMSRGSMREGTHYELERLGAGDALAPTRNLPRWSGHRHLAALCVAGGGAAIR